MSKKCKEIKRKKIKRTFLDNLPIGGLNRGNRIDWVASIGEFVDFQYDNICGKVKIVGYDYPNLYIQYNDENEYKICTSNFIKGMLGGLFEKNEIEIGQIFKDDKRDIVITDKNNNVYKYKCNKCGFECGEHYKNGEFRKELWITKDSLLKGTGCACCCTPSKAIVEGINDIETIAPWMIKYFANPDDAKKYTVGSGQKIFTVCPECGRRNKESLEIRNIYKSKSIGCICGDGIKYPEKFMFNILEQLNIEFKTQLNKSTFEWCKDYKYDFYISSLNLIIETDGGFHKKDNTLSGQSKEKSKEIDVIKDNLSRKHGINVIRIDCNKSELEFIKDKILNSDISKLFDLSNIDWFKCEEFALSNRVKEACELKQNNPYMTTLDIGNIMKLDRKTINGYLRKGTNLGWCNYDPKEEKTRSSKQNGEMNGRKTQVFKNGVLLGTFKSVKELAGQSEELFGIKLCRSCISAVCNGNRKSHKGFIFRYE